MISNRTHIINRFIKERNYNTYLEIGIADPSWHWDFVECKFKESVDPTSRGNPTYLMTSDEFFNQNNKTYDIIFIDGLHRAFQVYKDVINSLKVLNRGGVIICHDMIPSCEKDQTCEQDAAGNYPDKYRAWTGDCWKAWIKLRQTREDLSMYLINTDWGVGVIEKGTQSTLPDLGELSYIKIFSLMNYFELSNAISYKDFLSKKITSDD